MRVAPSAQVDSPSKVMNAARTTAITTATTSIGGKTSVNVANPKTWERMTSSGARTRAICIGELTTTEKAYSERPAAASWMPTTFSIALPAMATTTRPAKASEMCSADMAGSRATTNQSETKAASAAARASRPTASQTGHRGASWCISAVGSAGVDPRRKDAGRVTTKMTRSTTETRTDKVFSCGSAGVWT